MRQSSGSKEETVMEDAEGRYSEPVTPSASNFVDSVFPREARSGQTTDTDVDIADLKH